MAPDGLLTWLLLFECILPLFFFDELELDIEFDPMGPPSDAPVGFCELVFVAAPPLVVFADRPDGALPVALLPGFSVECDSLVAAPPFVCADAAMPLETNPHANADAISSRFAFSG